MTAAERDLLLAAVGGISDALYGIASSADALMHEINLLKVTIAALPVKQQPATEPKQLWLLEAA